MMRRRRYGWNKINSLPSSMGDIDLQTDRGIRWSGGLHMYGVAGVKKTRNLVTDSEDACEVSISSGWQVSRKRVIPLLTYIFLSHTIRSTKNKVIKFIAWHSHKNRFRNPLVSFIKSEFHV